MRPTLTADETITPRLQSLLDREPSLHIFGFGPCDEDRRQPPAERQTRLLARRQDLLDGSDRVAATCAWIQAHLTPSRTLNRQHSSYGLKHCAATDIGYLTNGTFIAAMLLCGYRHR